MEYKWVLSLSKEIQIFWTIGFCLSMIGLLLQILLYILVPRSRKLDQKLLTQLTVARLLHIVIEYLVSIVFLKKSIIRDAVLTIYLQTDAALICWMFFFTKNFYMKVVHTTYMKIRFIAVSIAIWTATIPLGILSPALMYINSDYFICFYQIYAGVKFAVLTVNLFYVCRIFRVAFTKPDRRAGVIKTCVMSFILLTISSAQAQGDIFVTDVLIPYCLDDVQPQLTLLFGVVNSYQVITITVIFVALVKNACVKPLTRTITERLLRETV